MSITYIMIAQNDLEHKGIRDGILLGCLVLSDPSR